MFSEQIQEFDKNISTLKDFVDEVDVFIKNRAKESLNKARPFFLKGIGKYVLTQMESEGNPKADKVSEICEQLDQSVKEDYGFNLDISIDNIKKGKNGELKLQGISFSGPKNEVENFAYRLNKYDNQLSLFYRSSFINLLCTVEWFFSQIIHAYYIKFPDASGIEKKTLTFSELKAIGSIEDAQSYLIDDKIENILRSSFEDWLKTLKTELKLKLGYINPIEKQLIEIYQRRNIIVHNGGIVNSIYLSKVDRSLTKEIQKGAEVSISKTYFKKAIDLLHKSFLLIACELWKNLESKNVNRADKLGDIIYDNLLIGNWDLAESLSLFITKDSEMGPIDKCIAQLNYWLCRKRKGEWSIIKTEVESANYSDKNNLLKIGLAALKEDKESFFKILPIMLQAGEINAKKVIEFPIFKEIIESDEFEQFTKDNPSFSFLENKNIQEGEILESTSINEKQSLSEKTASLNEIITLEKSEEQE